MDNNATKQTMISLLSNYHQLIVNQLNQYEMVGEYLTGKVEDNVRLLCQMRTIIFLIKTAPVLTIDNISLAEKLYFKAEEIYLEPNQWLQQSNAKQEANLYSYAFVILAQSYLYQSTKNPLYSLAMAETFSFIENRFSKTDIFKPLTDLDCLEQNSAMHLFEALTFAYYKADAIYMRFAIANLEEWIISNFWQASRQLLAEKVTDANTVLSYEAGHWFEWVSLLQKVEQCGGKPFIDKDKLFHAAVKHTTFTRNGFVLNEMDAQFQPLDTQKIRIWPCLEYLRAKKWVDHKWPIQELSMFMDSFFDESGLPKEYITEKPIATVKSTTGYHIAESFVDILLI